MAWTPEELEIIELIAANVEALHQAHFNYRAWDKTGDTITIYDTDKIRPLYLFDTNDDMSLINPRSITINSRVTSTGDVRVTSTGDARVAT